MTRPDSDPGDVFRVDDEGPGDATPFLIDQDGNVGIGMTSPNSSAPNGQPGNLDVNDVYLRGATPPRWASQGATLDYATTIEIGPIVGGGTDQTFDCPAGYVVTGIHGGGDTGGGGEIETIYIRCTRLQ